MNAKQIAALACGAALLLAACSSSPAPSTGTQQPGGTPGDGDGTPGGQPGGTPGDGDGGGAGEPTDPGPGLQAEYNGDLNEALDDVRDALTDVDAAVMAIDNPALTASQRLSRIDQAQGLIDQARTDLETALTDLRDTLAELVDAASGSAEAGTALRAALADVRNALAAAAGGTATAVERIGAVDALIAWAERQLDPEVVGSAEARLRAAEARLAAARVSISAGEGWAGNVAARTVFAFADVERRPRKYSARQYLADASLSDDGALEASDLPARLYEAGKVVMSGTGDVRSSGDRLRMRGMPVIYFGNNRLLYYPTRNADTAAQVAITLADIKNNRSTLLAGLTVAPGGLVIDMGGNGAEGLDLRQESISGFAPSLVVVPDERTTPPGGPFGTTGSLKGNDLRLNLGRSAASPQGNAEHYWRAALAPTPGLVAAAGGDTGWLRTPVGTAASGRTVYADLPLGVYEVRLSNHLGLIDRRSEDPDTYEHYTDDDVNYYLTYAAYGFMDFYRPGTSADTSDAAEHGSHRVFPFHAGYDAFKNEDGKRTTDIGGAAITSGTFKGRTMAVRFLVQARGPVTVTPEVVTRMRGDIELTATISGTQASNTITGTISDMHDWDPEGVWKNSTYMPNDLTFHTDGTIDAKGEFTGTFTPSSLPTGYGTGGYRGSFYGPKDSLEAAGTWIIGPPTSGSGNRWAVAGSFGAAHVRPDGTYGRTAVGN